mmetsp:Transcript_6962/g.6140  ORF Transcript_6962/g.6140 Transcript_6962/m.6140 type:complete len:90 (+) Transcript_6962:192-461(+)
MLRKNLSSMSMSINNNLLKLNNRIYKLQEPLFDNINQRNSEAACVDDDEYNPEAENLLNIHTEMQDQEDNLVRARRFGHESLKVGAELK